MNLTKARCKCGSPLNMVWSNRYDAYVCYDSCFEHIDQYEKDTNRLEMHQRHKEIPRLFLDTELDKIPSEKVRKFTRDTLSSEKDVSVLFHGTSGKGKSRATWLLIEDWALRHYPRQFMFTNARKLETLLIGSYSDSVKAHDRNLKMLCNIGLLVIDDLGKERLTPRLETDLFNIIDERMLNMMPTIITTNFNASGLIERFPTKETGMAFIRRVKDSYALIGTGSDNNETQ